MVSKLMVRVDSLLMRSTHGGRGYYRDKPLSSVSWLLALPVQDHMLVRTSRSRVRCTASQTLNHEILGISTEDQASEADGCPLQPSTVNQPRDKLLYGRELGSSPLTIENYFGLPFITFFSFLILKHSGVFICGLLGGLLPRPPKSTFLLPSCSRAGGEM